MRNVLFPQPTVGTQGMHTGKRPLLFLLHVTYEKHVGCKIRSRQLVKL